MASRSDQHPDHTPTKTRQTSAAWQTITPALRRWIIEQAQVGYAAPVVLQSLRDAGWDEDVAAEVLQLTLDGVKFFLTHGHRYSVKYTLDALLNAAYFAGADMVLFGHTHRAVSETMQGLYVVNPGTAGVGALCTYACIETENGAIRTVGIHAIPEA